MAHLPEENAFLWPLKWIKRLVTIKLIYLYIVLVSNYYYDIVVLVKCQQGFSPLLLACG